MQISLRPAAQADLAEIWFFGAERWSPDQADRYSGALMAAIARLADFPLIAPMVEGIEGYRRLLVKAHAVFYRVEGDDVVVIRVLHQSRDVGDLVG